MSIDLESSGSGGEDSYPLTFGQLSVWRDIDWVPRAAGTRPTLPSSSTCRTRFRWHRLKQALKRLDAKHESIRTVYDVSDPRRPLQRLLATHRGAGAGGGRGRLLDGGRAARQDAAPGLRHARRPAAAGDRGQHLGRHLGRGHRRPVVAVRTPHVDGRLVAPPAQTGPAGHARLWWAGDTTGPGLADRHRPRAAHEHAVAYQAGGRPAALPPGL